MDGALLSKFLELDTEKRELKEQLERATRERGAVEAELLEAFAEEGIDSIKKDGRTVYLHRQLWAKAKDGDRERAVAILRKCRLQEYIREDFNTQQVSAFAREHDKEGTSLPKHFDTGFDVSEVFSIRTRKAGAK